MTHKKGFTLIELMVVISTIGTLSSIILASLKDAQAKARDSVRVQQVRQLDNATRSYVYANNQAPELSTCNPNTGTGCVAKSNAANGTTEKNAWNAYLSEMDNYIGATPVDPCGTSGCAVVGSSENTGYTYISPGGVQYYCNQLGTCGIDDYTESYQLSANLETNSTPSYGEGGYTGSLVAIPSPHNVTIEVYVGTNLITSTQNGGCQAYVTGPGGFSAFPPCVTATPITTSGTYSIQYIRGFPVGARSVPPVIQPSGPQNYNGNNNLIFRMYFQPL